MPHAKLVVLLVIVGLVAVAGCATSDREAGSAGTESSAGWTVGWGQLKTGMNAVEVLEVLDEPVDVRVSKVSTTWYYSGRGESGPYVVFDTRRSSVERWRAPKK